MGRYVFVSDSADVQSPEAEEKYGGWVNCRPKAQSMHISPECISEQWLFLFKMFIYRFSADRNFRDG